jgi:SAM-dependent methyltransferase
MAVKNPWERSNRVHFDEIVINYDKARWEYPDELYNDIFTYCLPDKNRTNKKAIEIGAGTGKATTPFLDAGYDVTAVELGANMVDFLARKFDGRKNFSVVNGTFENAALTEGSFDLIYAATAFHWVDAEIGCPKAYRLLKNGGAFALFRNNNVPAAGEELYEEIQHVYEQHYNSHYTFNKRPIQKSREEYWKPSEIYTSFRFEDMAQYGFRDITMKFYNASRKYSADDYIALLDTYSDHRKLPEENRAKLYAGVREAIIKHGGQHRLDSLFQLYMGRK